MWYSCHLAASSVRPAWASTTYVNAGNGGQVYNATTGGAVPMPAAASQRYLTTCGVSTPNIGGFVFAMLLDVLWAGGAVISANATLTPTSEPTLTRYQNNYPNAYNSAGNMLLCVLQATMTFTVAGTITFTYNAEAGASHNTSAITYPATGQVSPRVVFNHLPASATVNKRLALCAAGSRRPGSAKSHHHRHRRSYRDLGDNGLHNRPAATRHPFHRRQQLHRARFHDQHGRTHQW